MISQVKKKTFIFLPKIIIYIPMIDVWIWQKHFRLSCSQSYTVPISNRFSNCRTHSFNIWRQTLLEKKLWHSQSEKNIQVYTGTTRTKTNSKLKPCGQSQFQPHKYQRATISLLRWGNIPHGSTPSWKRRLGNAAEVPLDWCQNL